MTCRRTWRLNSIRPETSGELSFVAFYVMLEDSGSILSTPQNPRGAAMEEIAALPKNP